MSIDGFDQGEEAKEGVGDGEQVEHLLPLELLLIH